MSNYSRSSICVSYHLMGWQHRVSCGRNSTCVNAYEYASPNTEKREMENRIVSRRKLPNLHTRDAQAQGQHFSSKTGVGGRSADSRARFGLLSRWEARILWNTFRQHWQGFQKIGVGEKYGAKIWVNFEAHTGRVGYDFFPND